jgi:hypothetical protein
MRAKQEYEVCLRTYLRGLGGEGVDGVAPWDCWKAETGRQSAFPVRLLLDRSLLQAKLTVRAVLFVLLQATGQIVQHVTLTPCSPRRSSL